MSLSYAEERQLRHLHSLGWTPMAISAELNRPRDVVHHFLVSMDDTHADDAAMDDVMDMAVDSESQPHGVATSRSASAPTDPAATLLAKRGRGRPKGRTNHKVEAKKVVRNPKQATVTTKSGAQLTLYQYQRFETREQGKLFIREFALAQGKRVLIDRSVSGGSNIVFVCKSEAPCAFKVRILRSKKKGETAFYITTLVTDHGEQCSGKVSITKKQVMKEIRTASETNTTLTLTGTEAQTIVDRIQGAGTVNPRVTTQASVLVKTTVDDSMTDVQKLQALLSQFQAQNASSSIQVDAYNANALRRAFLKLPYSTQIQKHSARILGFETTDLSPLSSYSGATLELVVKDGNNESYTLAAALCDGKTADNYAWFFNCCLSSGISLDVPIFCDRSFAVLTAIESLPVSCLLIQSTQHLLRNMKLHLHMPQIPKDVESLVLHAQAADTYEDFESLVALLGSKNLAAANHIKHMDPNVWAKYCYLRKYALYGAQSAALVTPTAASDSPAAEAAVDAAIRERGPIYLFQSYMERCMQAVYKRKRSATFWARSGQLLTAHGESVLEEQRSRAEACRVTPNDDETGSAYVWDTRSPVPKRRRVNLSANSCSCPFSDQFGLPCKHLVAAANFFNGGSNGGLWDIVKLCHPMYLTRGYADVYSQTSPVSMPLEEELSWSTSVQVVPVGPTNRCSLCHAYGHNKRRCPNSNTGATSGLV
ncbi:Mutatorlike transposase [Globisporangium polare]